MGANEPKKKKRRVVKRYRPRFPRQKPRPCEAAAFDPLGAGHGRGAPLPWCCGFSKFTGFPWRTTTMW